MIDALINDIVKLKKNKNELLKKSEKLKIGWTSIYTPEEIIHAAGMIPYHITGESRQNFPKASTYMHSNLCPYVLSSLEELLDGVHNFADGTIFINACDARRRMYDVWKYFDNSKFLYILDFSKSVNLNAKRYYRKQLQNLIRALENNFDCKINDDSLHKSILLWNKTRSLLSKLYEYRRMNNTAISGSQAIQIVKASMTGLREEFNKRLSRLLDNLDIEGSNIKPNNKYRILLCGGYFDHLDIIEIIENYGAVIGCENISMGLKYFEGQVDTTGDLLDALADHYLEKATCARMSDFEKRFNKLLTLVESYNIQSVVFFTLKFCDNNLLDFPLIKKKLNERGLPVFLIEAERSFENIEQIKTRIIAFLESQIGYANKI